MQGPYHIVIVGAGFTGTALAIHLVRSGRRGLHVSLIEARPRLGRGLAYGTAVPAHVLNTRARHMSLFADDPEHFLRWLASREAPSSPDSFASRQSYGDYIEDTLIECLTRRGARGPAFVAHAQARATRVERCGDQFRVELDTGRTLAANAVVIATGHPSPADPLAAWLEPGTRGYLRDPWSDEIRQIGRPDRVLILGTGLTMVDVVLALEHRAHRGEIDAMSRRGLLPRLHRPTDEPLPAKLREPLLDAVETDSVRALLRAVRAAIQSAALHGLTWHAVIDALRPATPRLWAALPAHERRRFMRHLRPYWEVHRHRLAPEPAATIARLQASGRLSVLAGRVRHAAAAGGRIVVERALRGQRIQASVLEKGDVEAYDWVVNCTGPKFAQSSGLPLDDAMVAAGLLERDPLGLGYETDRLGRAKSCRGPIDGIYVLGPACRARAFEQTSVPELREEAEGLAHELLARTRSVGTTPSRIVRRQQRSAKGTRKEATS